MKLDKEEAMDLTVKVYFDSTSDIRRFSVQIPSSETKYDDTYAAIVDKMKQLYPIGGSSQLQLSWKDDDGDRITMDKGEELKEAILNSNGILRIYAKVVDDEPQLKVEKEPASVEKKMENKPVSVEKKDACTTAALFFYTIESKMHGKLLTVRDGCAEPATPIVMWNKEAKPPLKSMWHFEPADGDRFWIVSALDPNMVMDVEEYSSAIRTRIILWPRKFPPATNQLFRWDGDFIESCVAEDRQLDVRDWEKDDGTRVQIYSRNSDQHKNLNQRWTAISC